jgi:hypothetical protein
VKALKGILITVPFFLTCIIAFGQQKSQDVFLDKDGIMRWGHTKEEVRAFGVNYTAMFAHAYRTAKKMNISLEKAIDDDVYHFSRLGFDLFRVHVWDTEISDTLGNLLQNDHLRLFDYALMKMKERGMKFVITPIAYWGNGWPERDEKTPGFSRKFGKGPSLTDSLAILAQENYLFQFVNHVNSYTRVAYKNDPDIIGFEISNEPHHGESADKVIRFINKMSRAIRKTGTKKLIFYNVSHSIHLADAYYSSEIQGGTFQWYPTGLGAGHELGGNLLPNVDRYVIPFASNPKFRKAAKIVYEFDAADVGRSYIYPAMARSFRQAGLQIAAHFAYDPTYMAHTNTEYGTHYMNLAYAPQKALSLMIASEVFHTIPMCKSFGAYPADTVFANFRVSYSKDLTEYVTPEKFFYTNHTSSSPSSIEKLLKIAGFGNSPIVKYEGTGAYFLDKLEDGIWRLEVMPDAIWIADPFTKTSPKKTVAVIDWNEWNMSINLRDLGDEFSVNGVNSGNTVRVQASSRSFSVRPGTYLLTRTGKTSKYSADQRWNNILLGEFAAPAETLTERYVFHKPAQEIVVQNEYTIKATIASAQKPDRAEVILWGSGFRQYTVPLKHVGGYEYQARIAGEDIKEGFFKYFIAVKFGAEAFTYPSGLQTHPWDWDFYDRSAYTVRVVKEASPVYLFNAATDHEKLSRQWTRGSMVIPLEPGKSLIAVQIEKLFIPDPENMNGEKISDYSMRFYFGDKIGGRKADIEKKEKIVFRGQSLGDSLTKVQVTLIQSDGAAFGAIVTLQKELGDYVIDLKTLKNVKIITLPRPYPTFLPYNFEGATVSKFDLSKIESLQISIGPGLSSEESRKALSIGIESVRLE